MTPGQISGKMDTQKQLNVPLEHGSGLLAQLEELLAQPLAVGAEDVGAFYGRRREMPDFALHRRNFIPSFYGVTEIFLRPRKIAL